MPSSNMSKRQIATNITKTFQPDIIKGGEGSRGGKVIGHTKSGKAIYGDKAAKHEHYKDFTDQDHHDASDAHYWHGIKLGNEKYNSPEAQEQHKLHSEHYYITEKGKKQKLQMDKEARREKAKLTSQEGKILKKNKKTIYDGLMKLGEKYFGKHHPGFVHGEYESVELSIIDAKEAEENEEPITSDAYYLGAIYNSETNKVEELPGYKEDEGDQITSKFVKDFYKKNKGKYLISYDAEQDSMSIIK